MVRLYPLFPSAAAAGRGLGQHSSIENPSPLFFSSQFLPFLFSDLFSYLFVSWFVYF